MVTLLVPVGKGTLSKFVFAVFTIPFGCTVNKASILLFLAAFICEMDSFTRHLESGSARGCFVRIWFIIPLTLHGSGISVRWASVSCAYELLQ